MKRLLVSLTATLLLIGNFAGGGIVGKNSTFFPADILLEKPHPLHTEPVSIGKDKMKGPVPGLHQKGIFILTVVKAVFLTGKAFSRFHMTNQRKCPAVVLGKGHRYRAAKAGPGRLVLSGLRGAGRVAGNGQTSARQLNGTDAGIVVGKRSGDRRTSVVSIV